MDSRDSVGVHPANQVAEHAGQTQPVDSRGLWPTFAVGTGHMIAATAMTPLIPLYAVARGASPTLVGVVAASSALLPLISGVWVGASTDVLGIRRMVQIAAIIHGASALLIGAASTIPLIIAGAAIAGLANNMMVIAAQTSVGHLSHARYRDRNYGLFAFWMSVGQMLGPLTSGFLAESYTIRVAFYGCAVIATSPLLFAFRIARPQRRPAPGEPGRLVRANDVYRSAWGLLKRRDLRFILWIAFLIIFAWSIKSSFLPLYLQSVGMPKAEIGLIFSFMGGGAMIVRPFIGTLAGRFGRRGVLLGAVMLGAAAIGTIPLLRQFWPLATVAVAGGIARASPSRLPSA